jgi:hypothetical protein
MEILLEVIECAEHGIFGPHLEPLRSKFTDQILIGVAGQLLLMLDVYDVPQVSRRILSGLKMNPATLLPLRGIVKAVPVLAEALEVAENPDIFRDTVPQAKRDLVIKYVREHWHPIIET